MNQQQKPTYTEVKNRYEALRQVAREVAHDSLAPVLVGKSGQAVSKAHIELGGFDQKCEKALRVYQRSSHRRVSWDWDEVRKSYRSEPKRFELAIWHRGYILCGASIGKPTWNGSKLRLDYIEANPEGSLLEGRTTDIALVAATAYARSIGAVQLRIMKPVNENVKNHYLSKPGFSFDERNNFCYRNL